MSKIDVNIDEARCDLAAFFVGQRANLCMKA